MVEIWHLGNTGVRNPARIQDALIAYSESPFLGKITGRENEIAFENYLREKGIIPKSENKTNENDGTYGRKWRYVFFRSGFIYPPARAKGMKFDAEALGGSPCAITPLGQELVKANTFEAVEEIFLRSTSEPVFPLSGNEYFSPLRWTLAVILAIEKRTGEAFVSFPEFAGYVQTSTPLDDVEEVVNNILKLRNERAKAQYKKKFDRDFYKEIGENYTKKCGNFSQYGDTNLRYMRLTGLFHSKGRGIELNREKRSLAIALSKDLISRKSLFDVFKELDAGPALPTDELSNALDALNDLIKELEMRHIPFEAPSQDDMKSALAINRVRFALENVLHKQNEIDFANSQAKQTNEIGDYMDLLITGKSQMTLDDDEIMIPSGERPAYLEWVLWRAILALDHLKNLPYNVRKFNVDGDFLPRSTAAGGTPDLVAEFDSCIVVIEVTLSSSSRQEAMEGSPVRKHVADLMVQSKKPVFGLFIANSFDPNTLDDFHRGVWYDESYHKFDLHIVPLTLSQFKDCFMNIFAKDLEADQPLLTLMNLCDEDRQKTSFQEWPVSIEKRVKTFISSTN